MSTATLQRPDAFASLAADNDNFDIAEGKLDIHVRRAVARMIAFCEDNPSAALFLAHGLIVDTLGDIAGQIREYFPAYIDVSPIIEDITLVATNTARKSNQRFQEVTLSYIADGKMPEPDDANKQSFVKWYSVEGATNQGGFDGFTKHLKPGWSGGAGGSGADMLKFLGLGTKKGFLLIVAALDISDARIQSLIADMDMVQAFGANPAVLTAVADVIAAGGAPAKQMEAVVQSLVDIKTLKAALTHAEGTPQAPIIATALAIKVEALSVTLPALQAVLPASIMPHITSHATSVRTDMGASQMARAIEAIAAAPLPANITTTAQVIKAVDAVKKVAEANNLSIADVVNLVMTRAASPALIEPVSKLITLLSRPEVLPAIERSLPQATAMAIRADLVTPPLVLAASTPIPANPVMQALRQIAEKTAHPTLTVAVAALMSAMPVMSTQVSTPQPLMPPTQVIQSVVENLQAMTISKSTTPEIKQELSVLTPIIQTLAIQSREPVIVPAPQQAMQPQLIAQSLAQIATTTSDPTIVQMVTALERAPTPQTLQNVADNLQAMNLLQSTPADVKAEIARVLEQATTMLAPRAPDVLSPQSPLSTVAAALDLPIPSHVAPVPHSYVQPVPDLKIAPTPDFKFTTPANPTVDKTIIKGPDVKEAGCGSKICKTCFNKTCQALNDNALEAINRDLGVAVDYRPKTI